MGKLLNLVHVAGYSGLTRLLARQPDTG